MIKACIFDLDGTLLYTLDSMAEAANHMLRDLDMEELPADNFRYYCGDGARALVQRVLADAGDKNAELMDRAYPLYMKYFGEDPLYNVDYFPGIRQALSDLKDRGLRLAVCSNKPDAQTQAVIEKMYPDVFDAVIGQREGLLPKPSPDMALEAVRRLGVDPSECLYFGDSGTDMRTGKAAGLYTIGVLWGYRDLEELEDGGADDAIFSPADIAGLLGRFAVKDDAE